MAQKHMTTEIRRVTPKQAMIWLEKDVNSKNRPVNQQYVERLTRDIKEGRWVPNHQGIGFDWNGQLVDGQHRLWAVVNADEAVELLVVHGMDPKAREVVDDHMRRSVRDVMAIQTGEAVGNLHVAISAAMTTLETRAKASARVQTRTERMGFLKRNWDAVEFAVKAFPKSIRGVTTGTVRGVIARAYYTVDHDKLTRFCAVLSSGRQESKDEDIIITLRNWLIEGRIQRGMSRGVEVFGKTQRALLAYIERKPIVKLYASTDNLFDLPKNKRWDHGHQDPMKGGEKRYERPEETSGVVGVRLLAARDSQRPVDQGSASRDWARLLDARGAHRRAA